MQWVVRFAYGYLHFDDATVLADRGAAMFNGQIQLAAMTTHLFGAARARPHCRLRPSLTHFIYRVRELIHERLCF